MGALIQGGKIVLVILFTIGVVGTWRLGFANGTFKLIDSLTASPKPVLPGTNIGVQHQRTGISRVDELLATILTFFYPIFAGQSPELTLQSLHFYGQLIATWLLMLVEGSRIGNAWTLTSFVTLWGLLIENVAMALAVPAWCLLHLLSSTTLLQHNSAVKRQATLLVHPTVLSIMPWAVLIGCGIPSLMAFVTRPDIAQPIYQSQQFWILARMVHPILTAVVQMLLSMAISSRGDYEPVKKRNYAVLKNMQSIYNVATAVAIVLHVSVLSISISTLINPSMFAGPHRTMLHPVELFRPKPFWAETKAVESIAEGARVFLQWDELVSCCSILLWAFVINRHSSMGEPGASGLTSTVGRAIAWTVVGGPATAAIKLVQERDEWVIGYLEVDQKEVDVARAEARKEAIEAARADSSSSEDEEEPQMMGGLPTSTSSAQH